jgi:hypothetical protein
MRSVSSTLSGRRAGKFGSQFYLSFRELYFWQGKTLMAAALSAENKFSVPRELFKGDDFVGVGTNWPVYAVGKDGRFLMIRDVESSSQQPDQKINIIVNWFEELKRLVPTR